PRHLARFLHHGRLAFPMRLLGEGSSSSRGVVRSPREHKAKGPGVKVQADPYPELLKQWNWIRAFSSFRTASLTHPQGAISPKTDPAARMSRPGPAGLAGQTIPPVP